jgi:hypothetical protein
LEPDGDCAILSASGPLPVTRLSDEAAARFLAHPRHPLEHWAAVEHQLNRGTMKAMNRATWWLAFWVALWLALLLIALWLMT